MDGGSTDGSRAVIERYENWIDHWESGPDDEQSDAINRGFSRATGDILAWLNIDNRYLPGALDSVANAFMTSPEIDVLVGSATQRRLDGSLVYRADPPELTLESFLHWRDRERPRGTGNFLQPACFFRREAWEVCGPLRTDLEYCMDVDLWLKMVRSFTFAATSEELADALKHSEAKTFADRERTRAEVALLIASHGGWEIARRDLFKQADELSGLRQRLFELKRHPAYRTI